MLSYCASETCCLRLRTAYLNLRLAERFIEERTPDDGQPASTHTLCQKRESFFNFFVDLFQPGTTG